MRDNAIRNHAAEASETTGLPIHGTINSSNPDIKSAIDLCKYFGGMSVFVVAGRVNKKTSYSENHKTTQDILRRALRHTEKNNIRLLAGNVMNNFICTSPRNWWQIGSGKRVERPDR